MRHLVVLLLAVLMPLQWSIAAAAAHCHDEGGHAQPARHAQGGQAIRHGHAAHHGQLASVAHSHASAHGAPPARSADADAHGPAGRAVDVPVSADVRDAGDGAAGGHAQVDLHACCHGASLPTTLADPLPAPVPASFEKPAAVPAPPSRAFEGPFRPPRSPAA